MKKNQELLNELVEDVRIICSVEMDDITKAALRQCFGESLDKHVVMPEKSETSEKPIPEPPEFPLGRVLRQGATNFCECGSTAHRTGFLGLLGELACDNDKCPNSKKRFR